MYRLALLLSILSLLLEGALSNDNGFLCQCYCSVSQYIFDSGKMSLDSVEYFADIRPIPLGLPGKDGILEFSDSQPKLRSLNGAVTEYRTGTIALWNSVINLKSLSAVDKPEGEHSMIDLVSSFDEIFLNVNRISDSAMNIDNKSPAVLIFKNKNGEDTFNDEEYRQRYCERACQRPVSNLKKYSFSKTEFVELSYRGNIFNQYPARDSSYYSGLEESIKTNSGKGKCEAIAASMTGTETAWHLIFEEIRREKTEQLLQEKFLQMYPVLLRSSSSPVSIELTTSSKSDFANTASARVKSFERFMKKTHGINFFDLPENMPAILEQQISPLFQFRAKLVLEGNAWRVSEIYSGSETASADYSNEFLNLLLSREEVDRLVAGQTEIVEAWAEKFWNSGHAETHVVLPAPLESLEEISRRDDQLENLERWIQAKERQVRNNMGDVAISLLQFSAEKNPIHFHLKATGHPEAPYNEEPQKSTQYEAEESEPSPLKQGEELHIVYYGLLTLNCFTHHTQTDSVVSAHHSNMVALNIFPDILLRRDSDNSFRRIQIPKNEKRWKTIDRVFDSDNSISNLIRNSSYSFVLQLAKYNPQLYLILFRDLKYIFGFNNPKIFSLNTCRVPTNSHHVEIISENENTLQKTINKVLFSDPFHNISASKIKFSDVNHFNSLVNTMSKCLGVVPPTARVRVNDHFKHQRSVVSDYVCAADGENQNYLLQLYSKYNVN
ncbi:signal peptide-containing protein [Cryptosporidium canis]|uniref:Signal peptide-containing protein n=1 Tax=Cryptosporidium canis TaxID=195482 RepID=A0A9D5DDT8_9CRYT|nr:signal peptide-containing protein [Cryptosporidium canis]